MLTPHEWDVAKCFPPPVAGSGEPSERIHLDDLFERACIDEHFSGVVNSLVNKGVLGFFGRHVWLTDVGARIVSLGDIGMRWEYSDGGREKAGYKGYAGDCVCRAITIATQQPYRKVYRDLNVFGKTLHENGVFRKKRNCSSRDGVNRDVIRRYMASIGWDWHPTMKIGTGCKVHLRKCELPQGRLVVSLSKHLTAVIDGVIYDTYDPSREGTRCVYGYWTQMRMRRTKWITT